MQKRIRKYTGLIALFLLSSVAFATEYDFVVATDRTGDFRTVQGAIHAVPDFRKNETQIFVAVCSTPDFEALKQ